MSNYATNDYRDLAERLAKGFTEDSAEDLKNILDEDCEYISEYNENSPHFHNRQEIIDHMSYVDSNVDDSTRYHYQIIDLREYPEEEFDISSVAGFPNVAPYGIRLFQFKEKALVAIVVFSVTEEGKIDHIILSRSEEFNDEIYHRVEEKDLPDDLLIDFPVLENPHRLSRCKLPDNLIIYLCLVISHFPAPLHFTLPPAHCTGIQTSCY